MNADLGLVLATLAAGVVSMVLDLLNGVLE